MAQRPNGKTNNKLKLYIPDPLFHCGFAPLRLYAIAPLRLYVFKPIQIYKV
jgi:hypothetical protein